MTRPGQIPLSTRRQFIAAGSLGALALAGCGSQSSGPSGGGTPKRGGTLREIRYEATDGFKLDGQTANTSYQVSQAVMEPLLRANSDARTVDPGLAQSFTYDPKGPVYTLTLAPGRARGVLFRRRSHPGLASARAHQSRPRTSSSRFASGSQVRTTGPSTR